MGYNLLTLEWAYLILNGGIDSYLPFKQLFLIRTLHLSYCRVA
ncbi:MAG: hypothetical protein ACRCZZ_06225 [Phocaeicola sp.]